MNLSSFFVSRIHPKVIGLCEPFQNGINDSLADIPGYTIERLNKSKISKGGLSFYIANGCTYSVRKDLSFNFERVFELLYIELLIDQKSILFAQVITLLMDPLVFP